ncbi:MAG: hypothetical protein U5R46_00450 [Gammaproteobacteria bacterium]|nr:hypothetical protein [Gammaproteobacteria bacterium]
MSFLLSQLFALLAFLLPLKAVLLLAREGVPWFLAGVATVDTKNTVVLAIAVVAVGSYGLHLLADQWLDKAVRRGAEKIVGRSNKLRLFNNQVELVQNGYRRLCQVGGTVVIILLGFCVGFLINPVLFGSFAGLLLAEYGILYVLMKSGTRLGRNLNALFEDKLPVAVRVLSNTNFLIVFAVLVAQFMSGARGSLIIAIMSIVLIRQMTQMIIAGIQDLVFLGKNTPPDYRIVLYFGSYTPFEQKYICSCQFLSVSSRNDTLSSALSTVLQKPVKGVRIKWLDSDLPGVAYFEAETLCGESRQEPGTERRREAAT